MHLRRKEIPKLDHILVIDLGTTYFKASVFDSSGRMQALTRIATPSSSNEHGRSEIDVHVFHDTLTKLVRNLDDELPGILSQISAITFATQTNSFVLLGENDSPLTPIIIWNDARAAEDQTIASTLAGLRGLQPVTGVPELSSEFMIAKLLWFREHAPDVFSKSKKLCLISDYFTLWLTGKHITEAGTAALTGLLDIHSVRWWDDALQHFKTDRAWLPEVVRAGTDLGPILSKRAEDLGLPMKCKFVAGCLDQYAGAIGVRNVSPGGISETTGTVLATVKCANAFKADAASGIFQGPAFAPGLYYQMVFGDTAGNWLEAYRESLSDRPSFAQLDNEAAQVESGCEGLTLSPGSDATMRETYLADFTQSHSRGHAVRTILETVSFALADQVTLLCNENTPTQISCAGGAARSRLWLQIKADTLNCTMVAGQSAEPTSLGAAILAMHALSGQSVQHVAEAWVQIAHTIVPDETQHQTYTTLRAQA